MVVKVKGKGSTLITQWVILRLFLVCKVPLCCFSVISDISYPFTNRLILYNSTFSAFGEKGKFLISGGNDSSVKLWGSHSLRIIYNLCSIFHETENVV